MTQQLCAFAGVALGKAVGTTEHARRGRR
jgi:hypothetical protein